MKLNIIKKKLLRISIALATAALSLVLVLNTGLGWFADTRSANPNLTGYVQGSYFESGTGTSDDPYEIKYPAQLYYLAWLQDLGVFNADTDGTINQTYFYLSDDLDMTGYVLPPIGTPTYPFVGNFDGNGKIISNLTVANDSSLTEVPSVSSDDYELSGYQIVGFFGVIGYGSNGETIVENENATDRVTIGGNAYTFESQVNEVKNFLLSTTTIQTKTPKDNKTLVGMAAGFVNGNMESVGVYNCSIETGTGFNSIDAKDAEGNALTDKLSNYSLIGYSKKAADAYTTAQGSGSGAGWGGSIDMESIFTRIKTIYGGTNAYNTGSTTKRNITYSQNVYNFYDENGEFADMVAASTATAYFREYDSNTTAGAFLYALRGENTYDNQYYYLNGGIRTNVSREYYYEDKQGYTIKDNDNTYYLSYNADFNTILHSTDEVVWFNDGNYYYFESYNISTNPIIKHYLDADNYGRVLLSDTENTEWTRTNDSMYCSKNGTNNYLLHVNGVNGGFGLSDNGRIYTFENDGNYLNLDSSSLNVVSSNSNDTEWLVTNGYIHTVINGTTYYLNTNGTAGLTVSTTPTTQWTIDSNSASAVIDNLQHYLQYDNGWILMPVSYKISIDDNYLQNDLSNEINYNNASSWVISNDGYIYWNGTYLRNNNGTLTTTTNKSNASIWTVEDNQIINGIYHLQYDNGWKLQKEEYYITNGTRYLTYNGSIQNNVTQQNNASLWTFSNGISENGTISTTYSGNTYYLRNNNGTLEVTNSSYNATSWTNDGTNIFDDMYYLQYDNGWKLVALGQKIYNGTNYLSYTGSISNETDPYDATYWKIDNGIISTIYNGSTYYLYNNDNNLDVTTNSDNATSWTIENGIYYDGEYFIDYNNDWKLTKFSYYIYDSTANRYITGNNGQAGNSTTPDANSTWYLTNDNYLQLSTYTNTYLKYYYSRGWTSTTYPAYITYSTDYTYYYVYNSSTGKLSAVYPGRWQDTTYYLRYNNGWTTSTTQNQGDDFQLIKANGTSLSTTTINNVVDLSISSIVFKEISKTLVMDNINNEFSLKNINTANKTTKHMIFRTSKFEYSDSYYVDYASKNSNLDYYYTYFPLSADEENNYAATNKNTGYIVGGSYSQTTTNTFPYGAGDIRISYYSRSGNVSNSISNNTIDDSKTYTINAGGNKTISSIGTNNFKRYSTAKENFEKILKNSNASNVYGLHFMNAKISKNAVVTAKHVLINGDSFDNYEMPASSINFSLKEKGYINFFAGTYFKNNDSFFSLHQIRRNKDSTSANFNKIESIKEILKIYEITDESLQRYSKFIYELKDDDTGNTTYESSDGKITYSNESAVFGAGYAEVFDTTWIKKSGSVIGDQGAGYLYYFEVPADEGEYCLGSVDGGTGAYLLYLDIAANGGDIDNEIMEYIGGVDFVKAADASLLAQIATNNPTACLALKTAFSDISQKITITRTDIDATHIKFTFTSNASTKQELMLETRYYKITSDQREITFEFVGV